MAEVEEEKEEEEEEGPQYICLVLGLFEVVVWRRRRIFNHPALRLYKEL